MEALLYFLLWGALIFFMMRFGCGAHVMGRGQRRTPGSEGAAPAGSLELRWVPPETDVDPRCGRTVDPQTAKASVHDGVVYFFCSHACREAFESALCQHLGGSEVAARDPEPSHG